MVPPIEEVQAANDYYKIEDILAQPNEFSFLVHQIEITPEKIEPKKVELPAIGKI